MEEFFCITNLHSEVQFIFDTTDKKDITADIIIIRINGEKLDLTKIFDKEEEKYYNIPKQMLHCMSSLDLFGMLVSDRYEAFKRGETLFHINSFEAFGLYFDDRGRTLVKHTSGDMCNITPLLINMNEKNNVCFKCNTVFTLEDILSLNLSLETKTTKQYYNNFSTEQPIGTILIHTTCPNISK